jgi:hypothetical protein
MTVPTKVSSTLQRLKHQLAYNVETWCELNHIDTQLFKYFGIIIGYEWAISPMVKTNNEGL